MLSIYVQKKRILFVFLVKTLRYLFALNPFFFFFFFFSSENVIIKFNLQTITAKLWSNERNSAFFFSKSWLKKFGRWVLKLNWFGDLGRVFVCQVFAIKFPDKRTKFKFCGRVKNVCVKCRNRRKIQQKLNVNSVVTFVWNFFLLVINVNHFITGWKI